MSYEETYTRMMGEYESLRSKAQSDRQKRMDEVYSIVPRIGEIDGLIYQLGLKNIKNIFNDVANKDRYNRELKENIKKLEDEKRQLVRDNKIDKNFDKLRYKCSICQDTGHVDGGKCRCFQQRLIQTGYTQSNIQKLLEKQNFESFSLDCYSKTVPANEPRSPYENMTEILHLCKMFCSDFDKLEKSLMFYGDTGLGKTFLSSCIAKQLIDDGKTVIYTRATHLFSLYEDYKFGRVTNDSVKDEINRVFDVDLLILDDLGTESVNKNTLPFFYDILESRLLNEKKLVISTNFNMNEISKTYSTRFTSRIYESFVPLRFFGEDIRVRSLK